MKGPGPPGAQAYFYYRLPDFKPNVPAGTPLSSYLGKIIFNMMGFNRYGLYHDDFLFEYPDVAEAYRRLPKELQDERNWRLLRATQLEIEHKLLPKEEWHTWEQDRANRYLQPYLEEVRREIREREEWIANQ